MTGRRRRRLVLAFAAACLAGSSSCGGGRRTGHPDDRSIPTFAALAALGKMARRHRARLLEG